MHTIARLLSLLCLNLPLCSPCRGDAGGGGAGGGDQHSRHSSRCATRSTAAHPPFLPCCRASARARRPPPGPHAAHLSPAVACHSFRPPVFPAVSSSSTACLPAGAAGFGVLLTAILPTTVEDLLALCLAAMVGYVSILNLPMRRAEAKRKLEHTTTAFAQVRAPRPGRFAGWRVHVVVVVVVGCVRVGVGVWCGGGGVGGRVGGSGKPHSPCSCAPGWPAGHPSQDAGGAEARAGCVRGGGALLHCAPGAGGRGWWAGAGPG